MTLFRYFLTSILILPGLSPLTAQQVPIGQWRDELPYTLCNSVTDAGDKIYASTPYAVFYINKEDYSAVRITKITGLSDIGISRINYNKEYKTLVIAYTNANIDLIKDNTIINISDIKRKPILGNKTINDIYFIGKDAYLSCGFGIVVLDINKEEIRDTYYIGQQGSPVNVWALTTDDNDSIFAASEKGIYKAWTKDPNLTNFASWHKDMGIDTAASYNTIVTFAGKVFVNKKKGPTSSDTLCIFSNGKWSHWDRDSYSSVMHLQANDKYLMVTYDYFICEFNPTLELVTTIWTYNPGMPYPTDALADQAGNLWISDTYSGLINYDAATKVLNHISLSGPLTASAFSMTSQGDNLLIAPGGRDASYGPLYYQAQIYHFDNTNWKNISGTTSPLMGSAYDIVAVAIDPFDNKHSYAGSFGKGVLELYNDSAIRRYSEGNSTLRHHTASDTSDVRVGGLTFDSDGNLWVVTAHNNSCLSMKKGNQWTGFTIPIANESDLGQIIVNRLGQKWIQMRYGNMNPNSILVFTDNGTPQNPSDDQSRLLNSSVGSGAIPGNYVFAMAEDKNGQIWIGTEKGVAVFYSPENMFNGQNFDCQRILVQQGAYVQYLLENETVTAIVVDGANQKWIGTDRGGVFCFSEDGTKQKYHFTAENSPLLSDRIICMAMNKDGDVFFGTDKGVVSFRGPATPGGDTNENVYAFPNPVKSDFSGFIAIKGLVSNAQVRITDVNGTLVYSTRAEGGQAIWDGRNFNGRKANTGVYLVYASNDSGTEKVVTKILIIN
ncbi:MAG: T9SS type A sorting domain-containing protein [Bacteroidales bacterium]|jgi:ligand-binding sensor domain-containing protein|nr:T9SS type A sorting domain-containing protein [Bacteroidales bacterium]